MQQVDKGKLKLDQTYKNILVDYKYLIKQENLLPCLICTYTSGVHFPDLTNITGPEYINNSIPMKEFFSNICQLWYGHTGEVYTYDNVAYALAGFAVENVTNTLFSKYMEKNIFKPLDMKSTSMSFTPDLLEEWLHIMVPLAIRFQQVGAV